MTEQAVKDAKAKRDAAQADLDKAVKDTRDEVEKATAAVKDAEATKPVAPVKVDPPKVDAPKVEPTKPAPLSPVGQAKQPVVVAHEASTSKRDGVLVLLAVGACAAAAFAHFVLHAF